MLRQLIQRQVRSLVGGGRPPTDYLEPANDPGYFGPASMVWEVHRDFVSMMIGGVSALILQAQHPLVLAGVWDHSNFRQDLRGRLKRTAYFIAATTYGGTEMASRAVARVKSIHDRLSGTLPDGRKYRVSDPRLLYWVHLTETSCFLSAYETFLQRPLPTPRRDRYFAEMSRIAAELGCASTDAGEAVEIARTYDAIQRDLRRYLPELAFDERTRSVLDLVENAPSEPHLRPFNRLVMKAAFGNLPDWVYPLIGRRAPSFAERTLLNESVRIMAKPIRWATRDGIYAHARRRMGLT